jgi:hypothetical protein
MSICKHTHWVFSQGTAYVDLPRLTSQVDYQNAWQLYKASIYQDLQAPNSRIVVLLTRDIDPKYRGCVPEHYWSFYSVNRTQVVEYKGPDRKAHFKLIGTGPVYLYVLQLMTANEVYAEDIEYLYTNVKPSEELLGHLSMDIKEGRKLTMGGHRARQIRPVESTATRTGWKQAAIH